MAVAVVADRDSGLQECGAEVVELLPLLAVSFNPRHLFLRAWRCSLPSWEFLVLSGSLVPGQVGLGLAHPGLVEVSLPLARKWNWVIFKPFQIKLFCHSITQF